MGLQDDLCYELHRRIRKANRWLALPKWCIWMFRTRFGSHRVYDIMQEATPLVRTVEEERAITAACTKESERATSLVRTVEEERAI